MFPHCGGPFLEGLSSCDYYGRQHFPDTIPDPTDKKEASMRHSGMDEDMEGNEQGCTDIHNSDVKGNNGTATDDNDIGMDCDDECDIKPQISQGNIDSAVATIKCETGVKLEGKVKLETEIKQEDKKNVSIKLELSELDVDDIPLPDIPPRIANTIHSISKLEVAAELESKEVVAAVTSAATPVNGSTPLASTAITSAITSTTESSTANSTSNSNANSPFKELPTSNFSSNGSITAAIGVVSTTTSGLVNSINTDSSSITTAAVSVANVTASSTVNSSSNSTSNSSSSSGSSSSSSSSTTTTTTGVVARELIATGLGLIPGQYLRPEHVVQAEHLSFSLVPRMFCCPPQHFTEDGGNSGGSRDTGTPSASPPSNSFYNGTQQQQSPATACAVAGATPVSGTSISSAVNPTTTSAAVSNSGVMSHKELLEKLHQTDEAVPIPTGE